jgi:hypothetical protein
MIFVIPNGFVKLTSFPQAKRNSWKVKLTSFPQAKRNSWKVNNSFCAVIYQGTTDEERNNKSPNWYETAAVCCSALNGPAVTIQAWGPVGVTTTSIARLT